jgi:regulator of RNase E activity RraA
MQLQFVIRETDVGSIGSNNISRPGRNEVESVNRPIVLGGVLVMPGDVMVADGDGVIVVPRAVAFEVARYAHKVIAGDKNARRDLCKKLGLPEDKSTK